MKLFQIALVSCLLISAACHPGPVVGTGPRPPAVGGTIAGIVSTEGKAPVPNRKVTAIDTATNARFDATTGANGGYTIKVPQGTYRLELELLSGESVAQQPGETRVHRSDLDPRRNFVITTGRPK